MLYNDISIVWVYTFSDPEIWQEKNKDSSIYIHQIATNPKFKKRNMVSKIFTFTESYAKALLIKLIRLDTAGFNKGLIDLYAENGFGFLGITKIEDTKNLPSHYNMLDICLFERKLKYSFLQRFFSNTISGAKDLSMFR